MHVHTWHNVNNVLLWYGNVAITQQEWQLIGESHPQVEKYSRIGLAFDLSCQAIASADETQQSVVFLQEVTFYCFQFSGYVWQKTVPVWPLGWSRGWWSAPHWRGTVCPYWWVWQWRRCSSWPLPDSASKQIHPQPAEIQPQVKQDMFQVHFYKSATFIYSLQIWPEFEICWSRATIRKVCNTNHQRIISSL